MARSSSAALPLVALAAVLCLFYQAVDFVTVGAPLGAGAGAASRATPRPESLPAVSARDSAPQSAAPGRERLAFSGTTLVPSLLMAARVTVSVCAAVARRAKAPVSEYQAPTGVRNFQEMALGFTSDIAKNNLGESLYRPWVPFVTTIFLFIFGSNWSGALVPWKLLELPAGELAAPTNNINTTVALSLLTSVAYFGGGLFRKGLGYFARYVKPTPILLPINILEDFTKPLSLSFRLFGNVLADELTVAVLTFLVPFVIPLPIMALGIFAGSIQALIFATLASAYIFEACEGEAFDIVKTAAAAATATDVTTKLVALNRAGHWPKGSGIDGRACSTLRSLKPQRALEILDELEAKVATVKNPSAFIQLASRIASAPQDPGRPSPGPGVAAPKPGAAAPKPGAAAPRPSAAPGQGPRPSAAPADAAAARGVKRPAPVQPEAEPPSAKRLAAPPTAAVSSTASGGAAAAPASGAGGNTVKISAAVAAKIQALKQQGTRLAASAIRELASAEVKQALILLQALVNGKQVDDPSKWVIASLQQRGQAKPEAEAAPKPGASAAKPAAPATTSPVVAAKAPVAKTPVAKAPVAKTPVAKAPVAKTPAAKAPAAEAPAAKAPVAKTPVAKTPVAKTPVAKTPVGKAPARPGTGQPPKVRNDLEFDEMALQAQLLTLNKANIWPGPHPLDEATFATLLNMKDAQRAMEILNDIEEQGTALANPREYVLKEVEAELKKRW